MLPCFFLAYGILQTFFAGLSDDSPMSTVLTWYLPSVFTWSSSNKDIDDTVQFFPTIVFYISRYYKVETVNNIISLKNANDLVIHQNVFGGEILFY